MSSTFLHRFFDLAKTDGKSNAFHFYINQEYHFIPRWLLRSKIKHFCMGIFHLGGQQGQYIYLFPFHDPEWIYAYLGALTAGLQAVPLPSQPDSQFLKDCLNRFPPSFIFYGKGIPSETKEMISKTSKQALWIGKWDLPFRQVFNLGIIHESQKHRFYRESRDRITPETVISPLRLAPEGKWEFQPLIFSHIEKLQGALSAHLPGKKLQFILAQPNFGFTTDQLLAIFWPLATQRECVLLEPEKSNHQIFRSWNPQLALVPVDQLKRWSDLKGFPWNHPKGIWKGLRQKKHLRKILGKRIQKLWISSPLSPGLEEGWKSLPIQVQTVPISPNFPL
ncbi:MAG: hypothetical protein R3257_01725 [bacterium]|nr:hypothetical protein [bacterium]